MIRGIDHWFRNIPEVKDLRHLLKITQELFCRRLADHRLQRIGLLLANNPTQYGPFLYVQIPEYMVDYKQLYPDPEIQAANWIEARPILCKPAPFHLEAR